MLDVAPTELLMVAVVALLVIGPKDLPAALRTLGRFVGRIRGVARQFRSGFDEMVRQAELDEMEKSWAKENARIMALYPPPAEEAQDQAFAAGPEGPVMPDGAPVPQLAAPAAEDAAVASAVPAAGSAPLERPVGDRAGDRG